MSETKTIYIVTVGERGEDYEINAVFSTREKAEHYTSITGGTIEEWIVDNPEHINLVSSTAYVVFMEDDGKVKANYIWYGQVHPKGSRGFAEELGHNTFAPFRGVSYESMENARTLAEECRQKWLHKNMWPSQ